MIIQTIGVNRSGLTFRRFPFNKAHFELYQSSTIHTHKFKIPRKLIILGVFIFVSCFFSCVSLVMTSFLVTGEFHKQPESPPAQVQARAAAVPAIYSWAAAEPCCACRWLHCQC